ncbi:MAG: DUF6443 domain-containing protein [Bacteroidota bacterium]
MRKHKLLWILSIWIGFGGPLWGQQKPHLSTIDHNYVIKSRAKVKANSEQAFHSLNTKESLEMDIQYMDGLGRLIQGIHWAASPSGKDEVYPFSYDNFGRPNKSYLPYTRLTQGIFQEEAISDQHGFYNLPTKGNYAQSSHPFSITQYEPAPLGRAIELGDVGEHWQPEPTSLGIQVENEHTIVHEYSTNTTPFPFFSIESGLGSGLNQVYPSGSLKMERIQDENGFWTEKYMTLEGLTLLKKMQVDSLTYAGTAFIYDAYRRPLFVIQPEGWKELSGMAQPVLTQAIIDSYCFHYQYDSRGRVKAKKIPGAGWTYMVYNKRNQLVLSQDGKAREKDQWLFTKYDVLGRPIMKGIYHSSQSRSHLQSLFDATFPAFELYESPTELSFLEKSGEAIEGYSNSSFPLLGTYTDVHLVTYYDSYDFDQNGVIHRTSESYKKPASASNRTQGFSTAVRVRVLNPDPDMPNWLWTVTYYDKEGRESMTVSDSHLNRDSEGKAVKYDRASYVYDFEGKMLREEVKHLSPGAVSSLSRKQSFGYDHSGNLTKESKSIRIGSQIVMNNLTAIYDYNELGRKVGDRLGPQKTAGTLPLQYVDYQYHIKGWLKGINSHDQDCATKRDIVPPASIQDLEISSDNPTSGSLQLSCTLPGDDGQEGGSITLLEIAMSTHPHLKDSILEGVTSPNLLLETRSGNFLQNGPYQETLVGLGNSPFAGQPTYFAVRAIDEMGNVSPFSNVKLITPLVDFTSVEVEEPEPYPYSGSDCISCVGVEGVRLGLDLHDMRLKVDVEKRPGGNQHIHFKLVEDLDLKMYTPGLGNNEWVNYKDSIASYFSYNLSGINSSYDGNVIDASITDQPGLTFPIEVQPGIFKTSEHLWEVRRILFEMIDDEIQSFGWSSQEVDKLKQSLYYALRQHLNQLLGAGSNHDVFSMNLIYENGFQGIDAQAKGQYNGNISGMIWRDPSSCDLNGYAYTYDGLSRLTHAKYGEYVSAGDPWDQHANRYNASFSYDLNGNIKHLQRSGLTGTAQQGLVDDLTYHYSGNRLTAVEDNASVPSAYDFFIEGIQSQNEFVYDESGNMVGDDNRSMIAEYNLYNKPVWVSKGGNQRLEYIYAADGTKLRQKWVSLGSASAAAFAGGTSSSGSHGQQLIKVTDYVGVWEYEDPDGEGAQPKELQHILHAQGKTVRNGQDWLDEFFLKDHLGNVRVVVGDYDGDYKINPDPNGDDMRQIVQGYYPFGLAHKGGENLATSPSNQYLFNGKELQDEMDLGWYDYGFRMYNPALGRWNGVDVLAEKYINWSPYTYTLNNPLRFVDPDGRMVEGPGDGIFRFLFKAEDYDWSDANETLAEITFELGIEVDEEGALYINAEAFHESIPDGVFFHADIIENEDGSVRVTVELSTSPTVAEVEETEETSGDGEVVTKFDDSEVSGSHGSKKTTTVREQTQNKGTFLRRSYDFSIKEDSKGKRAIVINRHGAPRKEEINMAFPAGLKPGRDSYEGKNLELILSTMLYRIP